MESVLQHFGDREALVKSITSRCSNLLIKPEYQEGINQSIKYKLFSQDTVDRLLNGTMPVNDSELLSIFNALGVAIDVALPILPLTEEAIFYWATEMEGIGAGPLHHEGGPTMDNEHKVKIFLTFKAFEELCGEPQ